MMPTRFARPSLALLTIALCAAPALHAQSTPQVTTADYDRAVRMLGFNLDPLVIGGTARASWLPDDRFYYRTTTPTGSAWMLVDPAHRTQAPLFDAARMAAALDRAGAGTIDARDIPARQVTVSKDASHVTLDVAGKRFTCDIAGTACTADEARHEGPPEVVSPDGKRAAFIRDWNLWVRDVATGKETQLTTDGSPNFGYATDNAGWVHSDRPILLWSPDSKKIATQQQDERHVGDMYLVDTRVGHPHLEAWKYPLPGDSVVAMIQRVIIDVDNGRITRLQTPPDYHRAMLGDDLNMDDLIWSPDGSQLAYVSTSRDHKHATVKLANASTGAVRTLFEESSPTQFESVAGWRILWPSHQIIWSSERDDWSQLYAYDLNTGKLLRKITTGAGPIQDIVHVYDHPDALLVEAQGRNASEDPYFRHYYRIGVNGKGWKALTPEIGDHSVQLSPSGRYMIDSWSTPDVPPTVVLRDATTGRTIMPITKADISRLVAAGWKPPIPIVTTARDGKTKLYGLMFRPTNFDSTKKYPIINNPYPGPQAGSVGPRFFIAARGDHQALAELGFVVITVDGMGTPGRSKSFHDAYYGAMGRDNTLPDQVAAMRELGKRYAWVDTTRAGIYGHSGGGFITADAMFRYPDFFKVGIAESGNHDQRNYEDDWGERYQGLLVRNGGSDNYAPEANQLVAKNLKGHLFLLHGSMDDNVPPSNTALVAEALIKANKSFDELIIPNVHHGYGAASIYVMRRRWDYFVRNLLGAEPPVNYEITMPRTSGMR
jgi:dipeptidyl aminopeptidase/acylaminoacyl peptidase